MGYDVPTSVQYMHDHVPRYDASQGMKAVSNDFGADVMGADKPYFVAVLSVAGAYFAIGILSFLIFAIVYLSYACCRPKARKVATGGCCARFGRLVFSPRLWYFVAALCMLGGTSAALGLLKTFQDGTEKTVTQFSTFRDLVHNVSEQTNNGISVGIASALSSAQDLYTEAGNNGAAAQQPDIQAFIDTLMGANTSIGTYSGKLNSMEASLAKELVSGDLDPKALGFKVFVGGVVALAVFLGFVFVTVFGLLGTKGAACFHRAFSACGLVLSMLLVFIFAGFFVAIATLGSDVCVAPSTSILSISNRTATAFTTDTLRFYTTCGSAASVVPAGAYASVLDGQVQLVDGFAKTADLAAAVGGNAWAAPLLADMTSALGTANASLNYVASAIACAPVYGIYDATLSALCGDGIVASIKTWGLATAACVLIYVLASAGARLCWAHPGDPMETDENKDGAHPGSEDLSDTQAQQAAQQQQGGAAVGGAPQLMYIPAAGYGHPGHNNAGAAGQAGQYA